MSASVIPSALTQLDVPSATAQAFLRRNAADTAYEWATPSAATEAGFNRGIIDVVRDYNAYANSYNDSTTLTADANATASVLTVADSSTFSVGQGIRIVGAGAAGADLVTSVTAVPSGVSVNISAQIVTTVLSGAAVYHDDTAAIQAAINSSADAYVVMPHGNYYVSSPITFSASTATTGVTLTGTPESPYSEGTVIHVVSDTDLFKIQANHTSVRNLKVFYHGVQTAGRAFHVGGANGSSIYYHWNCLESIWIIGAYIGIQTELSLKSRYSHIHIEQPYQYGILIMGNQSSHAGYWNNVYLEGGTWTGAAAGLRIEGSDNSMWTDIALNFWNIGIDIEGASDDVKSQQFNGLYMDNMGRIDFADTGKTTGYGIRIQQGAFSVSQIRIDGLNIGSAGKGYPTFPDNIVGLYIGPGVFDTIVSTARLSQWTGAGGAGTGIDIHGAGTMLSNITSECPTTIHINTGSVGTMISGMAHNTGATALLADNSAAITGAIHGLYAKGAAVTTTGSSVTLSGVIA